MRNIIIGSVAAFIICVLKHATCGGIYAPISLDSAYSLASKVAGISLGLSLVKPLVEFLAQHLPNVVPLKDKITAEGNLENPVDKITTYLISNPFNGQPGNLQGGNQQNNPMGNPQAGSSQANNPVPANPQGGQANNPYQANNPAPAPANPQRGPGNSPYRSNIHSTSHSVMQTLTGVNAGVNLTHIQPGATLITSNPIA